MADESKPMTEEELEDLFEEEKHEIGTRLEYLKSCDEYTSKEACDAIAYIRRSCSKLIDVQKIKKLSDNDDRLVDFMLKQGLAQLIVKVVKAVFGRASFDFRGHIAIIIAYMDHMRFTNKSVSQRFSVELVKSGVIRPLVKELDSYDPNTKDPKQRILITHTLNDLYRLLRTPNIIPIYRATNAVNVLMKFTDADNIMTKADSLAVLSCIVNETESQRLVTSGECIATILDILEKAAQSDDRPRQYRFVIKIDEKNKENFGITLRSQTEGINNLASNDANKEAIVQHGGVPILSAILRPEYTDEEKQMAVEALWKLSFLESSLDDILTHLTYTDTTGLEELKQMRSSANLKLRDVSQGLLHQLGLVDLHEELPVEQQTHPASPSSVSVAHPHEPPPSYQETMDAPHVMISYQWDHQERAIKIRDRLKQSGFNVWMDVDKLEGSILVAMANGVEKADAVLLCFSQAYKASVCCQAEAEYAFKLKKPIIPMKVDEDYAADGWLGVVMGMKKYIRAYSDEVLEKDWPHLVRELGNKGKV
ncbi:uncharacterized protein [Amphiura filiformis]|uniref:uncharacterized protein n=1 Tax=Amphiura filiformis TaxID=82378 RepID=UPI003B228C2A